jgi:hypothetical protein
MQLAASLVATGRSPLTARRLTAAAIVFAVTFAFASVVRQSAANAVLVGESKRANGGTRQGASPKLRIPVVVDATITKINFRKNLSEMPSGQAFAMAA